MPRTTQIAGREAGDSLWRKKDSRQILKKLLIVAIIALTSGTQCVYRRSQDVVNTRSVELQVRWNRWPSSAISQSHLGCRDQR